MGVLEKRYSVPRSVGAAALIAFGSLLVTGHAYHVLSHDGITLDTLFGGVVPLLLAVAVVGMGPILYRSRLDATGITTTVAWGFTSGLALGCVALLVAAHQALKGVPLHGTGYVIVTIVTGGTLVGTVTGRFDALNRQNAELIHSLQEATTALSAATTTDEVCRRAVGIANDVLDIPLTGIWLYDEDDGGLVPEAVAESETDALDSAPTYRPGNSLSWTAFESGRVERYDDVSRVPERHNMDTDVRSEIIVPLGDSGVMNFGTTEPARFGPLEETVAELLGTATEAALVRADREEALREQRRQLERQNDRLEEFSSVVSHDLRSPLSVARGRIELAYDDDAEPHLEAASAAIDDMESLIDDLLALAKQGETVGDTERTSIATIAKAAWRHVDTDDATLVTDDFELDADPDRLRQLLENLFGNAAMHAGPDPEIRIGPLAGGTGFFVEDNGVGIDSAVHDRIFEVGFTDHDEGTGFGLSIVRQIADAHGWSVEVTTETNAGARFEFRFD